MAHFINPVEEERCVFLMYERKIAPLEVVAARYELNELLESRQWNRVVMDVTPLSATQSALVLSDLAGGVFTGCPHNSRIAITVRPEEVQRARILEAAPQTNGVAIAIFTDEANAVAWVKATSSTE